MIKSPAPDKPKPWDVNNSFILATFFCENVGWIDAAFPVNAQGDPDPVRVPRFTGRTNLQALINGNPTYIPTQFPLTAQTVPDAMAEFADAMAAKVVEMNKQSFEKAILNGGKAS